ncbi:MAG: tetratricopeptide repeat protein [Bacteroidetes bacterium]|nr:tetratricopeptide repeat protein [Bacteroidota bacterium]
MVKGTLYTLAFLAFILYGSNARAQSKTAYLKAGDECLNRNDPFCALSNYRLALEYSEDAEVYLHIASAEKMLHNYKEALTWYQRCLGKSKDPEETKTALLASADLYKRLGDFAAADKCFDALTTNDPSNEKKWQQLKSDYKKAEQLYHDSVAFELFPLAGDINTAYSDFAPAPVGDSVLFYSSLRFFLFENNQKVATSRISSVPTNQALLPKSKTLNESINQAAFNKANASVSPDEKIMVFTRCLYDEHGKLICSLYESQFLNGMWQDAIKLNGQINPPGKTSTQPCITTNKSEGHLLLFSSNKSGGEGGMDIWWSKRKANGQYESPGNVGKEINSPNDEWSPFYDVELDSLYFSTEKEEGLGALDLYSISFSNRNTTKARGLPPPFNSGYNDLYYSRSYGEKVQQYLVSNRPPAIRLNGSSCCYDIFRLQPVTIKTDTVLTVISDQKEISGHAPVNAKEFAQLNIQQKIDKIKLNFPLRLYFDNDHPDPRSMLKTTDKRYDVLAENYLLRTSEYTAKQKNDSLKGLITGFFSDSVSANYNRLEAFTEQLYETLNSQTAGVKITIQGSASPLAERRYNLILSSRRIESLMNYWKSWKDGLMNTLLQTNKLEIVFIPAGEEQSPTGISDNLNDLSKSVYSKEAALERRIELVDISILK